MSIIEIFAGTVVLLCVAATAYLLTRPRGPVSVERSAEGGNACLRIRALRDILRLEVSSGEGEGGVKLSRGAVAKGEEVEFRFPQAPGRARILVEDGSGTHSLEA
jgi:hypothetical protein